MSEDLHEALNLYTQRIPEIERFEAPDIIRWIREDLEQLQIGPGRSRDYFLVAKSENRVCGFILLHYYLHAQLAFIAYLVAAKGSLGGNDLTERASKRLLAEVGHLLAEGDLRGCKGLLLEVDRPDPKLSEEEWVERLSRIRLFCMLAEAQNVSLRAFAMDYHQPPLSVTEPDVMVPMLLMHGGVRPAYPASHMSRNEVRKILKFIYTELYPESYSADKDENRRYRRCLRQCWSNRCQNLPRRVAMLDFKQVKAYFKRESLSGNSSTQTVEPEYKYDAFISYRHSVTDRTFALQLLRDLEASGLVVAIDERDFRPTANFLEEMERCVRQSRYTLCILSPRYFASGNTEEEAIICKVLDMSERRSRLLPLIIEEVQRPAWLYGIVGIDFMRADPLVAPLDKLKAFLSH